MGYSCCVPSCKTGYKPKKSDRPGASPKVPLFHFPREQYWKQKWIEAIPRKFWVVTKNHRVCAKHFSADDLTKDSHDTNSTRRGLRQISTLLRLRLKPGVVPHIFPGPSRCLSTPNPPKTQSINSGTSTRLVKQNSSTERRPNPKTPSVNSSTSRLAEENSSTEKRPNPKIQSISSSTSTRLYAEENSSTEKRPNPKIQSISSSTSSRLAAEENSSTEKRPNPKIQSISSSTSTRLAAEETSTDKRPNPKIQNISSSTSTRSTERRPNPKTQSINSSTSTRVVKENSSTEKRCSHSVQLQEVATLSLLKEKIQNETLPSGYATVCANDSLQFHFIEMPENVVNPPKLAISVLITENLEVFAFVKSKPVPRAIYEDVLPSGLVQNTTQVVNVLAVCKKLYTSGVDTGYINLAVSLLEDYLTAKTDSIALEEDHISLLQFIVEQLKLMQIHRKGRRYSTDTLMIAFLWRLASPALYKNLKHFFVLPSMSRLRQLSCEMAVEPRKMKLDHIRKHAKDLSSRERIVTLSVEEVNTAQTIEYTNGSLVGLTDDDRPARTVLAFMVQSLFSKYKDIACLIPVESLDTRLLRKWFEFVMKALNEFFLVIAVSIGNHVCSRKLFIELCGGELRPSIEHPVRRDEELFLIFDFTHNFKNIYNNFVNKKQMNPPTAGHENILGQSCVAEFNHIIRLYELEEDSPLKVAFQLKKESLYPSGSAHTSPQHALGVFSKSTVHGLEAFSKELCPGFLETAHYVKFIENIWSIMSVKSASRVAGERNPYCMPLQEMEEGHPGEQYLNEAIAIFREWQQSGRAGLTPETFTACIQTMTAVLALSKYLQRRHGVKYFLTGKVMSDPNGPKFGIHRQANGGNFFMSVKQLLLEEKKFCFLSLVQQRSLKSVLRINRPDPMSGSGDMLQSVDQYQWLADFLLNACIDDISDDDAAVVYFVSGYIGRSISGCRKCANCQKLLVSGCDVPDLDDCLPRIYRTVFEMADRGGLSQPTELCFALTSIALLYYYAVIANDDMHQALVGCQNQRYVFVKAVRQVLCSSNLIRPLLNISCESGHTNFDLIIQTAFNCFAQDEPDALTKIPSSVICQQTTSAKFENFVQIIINNNNY